MADFDRSRAGLQLLLSGSYDHADLLTREYLGMLDTNAATGPDDRSLVPCRGATTDVESCPSEAPASIVAESRHPASEPVIARFRAALARMQNTELERLYDRLPELDEPSRGAIRQFADALVAKILHPPLESLRDPVRGRSSPHLLRDLERLFQLED
jgi:hypothetical protein